MQIFRGAFDVDTALRMGARDVQTVLKSLCTASFGVSAATARSLREAYTTILEPASRSKHSTFYRVKEVQGKKQVDPLLVMLGGEQVPLITPACVVGFVLSATLDSDYALEAGLCFTASRIYAEWVKKLTPSSYPVKVGVCWIQEGIFLYDQEEASHHCYHFLDQEDQEFDSDGWEDHAEAEMET